MAKMSTRAALKEAQRRWGNGAGAQDRGPKRASTPERRAEAIKQIATLNEKVMEAEAEKPSEERTEKIRALRKEKRLWGEAHRYRYRVGHTTLGGMFFMVEGQGDTWEECFAAADESKRKDRERFAKAKAECAK